MENFFDKLTHLAQEIKASYFREFTDEIVIDLLDELAHRHDVVGNAILLVGKEGHKRLTTFDTFENTQANGDYLGTFYAYPVLRHQSYPSNCFIVAIYGENKKLLKSRTYYFEWEGDTNDLRSQQSE